MGDDNWDLSAVVRGCRISGSPAPAATRDSFSSFPHTTLAKAEEPAAGGDQACFTELEEICRPFFSKPQHERQPLLSPQRSNLYSNPSSSANALTTSTLTTVSAMVTPQRPRQFHHRPPSQISRSKRSRKNQQKRVVCHAPADGASADMWAWRKYGQKPIKGSPFPRGYYKCSSSKGCPARKQVERSRTDPGTLVITYTAEHNHPVPTHRNSLAGSTRNNKVPSSAAPAATAGGGDYPTAAGLSPNTPLDDELLGSPRRRCKSEEEESEEDVLLVEDMEVMDEDDVFFMGFDDVDRPTSGGFDDEHFFAPPWMASNHNTSNSATAAGGR